MSINILSLDICNCLYIQQAATHRWGTGVLHVGPTCYPAMFLIKLDNLLQFSCLTSKFQDIWRSANRGSCSPEGRGLSWSLHTYGWENAKWQYALAPNPWNAHSYTKIINQAFEVSPCTLPCPSQNTSSYPLSNLPPKFIPFISTISIHLYNLLI